MTTDADDPLAALRARFLARCQDDLAVLERAIAEPADLQNADIKLTVHRLSGTAGVFGFSALSALAAPIDDCLHGDKEPGLESLRVLADALRAIF